MDTSSSTTDSSELFIDKDKFDVSNMIFEKPLSFYTISRDMGIYYNDGQERKIIIETPKMMCPFSIKEFVNDNGKKYYKMSMSFTTLTNLYNEKEIRKFYQFIRTIDRRNEEYIEENKKKLGLPKKMEYRSTIKRLDDNFPQFMNVNLPYDENIGYLFPIYDEKATKSKIDIIKKRCIVSAVLELTDLKFMNTSYRANWNVLQLRKFHNYSPVQEYFMSGCVLCDRDDPNDVIYDNMIREYNKKVSQKIPLQLPASRQSSNIIPSGMTDPVYPMMQFMQMMMSSPNVPIFNNQNTVPLSLPPQKPPTDGAMKKGNPPTPPPSFRPTSQDELQAGMKRLKNVPVTEIKLPKDIGGVVLEKSMKKKKK